MRRTDTTLPRILVVVVVVAGCHARQPNPLFPGIGPLGYADSLTILDERTRGAKSLYAELELSYDGPERSGVFEAAFYFQEPASIRMTVFKDLILSTREIFDIVLTPDRYRLSFEGENGGSKTASGPSDGFAKEHTSFASFYWIREAFCLPGRSSTRKSDARIEMESRLSSGAIVNWEFLPRTLQVTGARIFDGTERIYRLDYDDYRAQEGVHVPGWVRIHDFTEGTKVEALLAYLEINPVLEDWVFDTDPSTPAP
ncbi:MAG: hypothetical protein HY720_28815 [Planctomycetes bacterium]|nr:hypothetical protein [Planctomycetota bacterium]